MKKLFTILILFLSCAAFGQSSVTLQVKGSNSLNILPYTWTGKTAPDTLGNLKFLRANYLPLSLLGNTTVHQNSHSLTFDGRLTVGSTISASSTITAPLLTINKGDIRTSEVTGIWFHNLSTANDSITKQNSTDAKFSGSAYDIATSSPHELDWKIGLRAMDGDPVNSKLVFRSRIDTTSSYHTNLELYDDGRVVMPSLPDTTAGYKALVIRADGTVQTAPYGGGGGTWGSITGTLSAQTDLQSALDAKENLSNKATAFGTLNNTLYPTTQAVSNFVTAFGYITAGSANTLTNKTISGSTNTFSNIPYSALTGTPTVMTSANFVYNEVPSGTINGTNVTFTLAYTPVSGKVSAFKNGVLLKPATDYSITGNAVTYTVAPSNTGYTDVLLFNYIK